MQFKTIVRPEHLNHHGNLFGGYMLLWVDEYVYITAIEEYPSVRFVTRGMDAVSFSRGVKCGSVVTFDVERSHTGTTSVTYQVDVSARLLSDTESIPVFHTSVTMCSVDENGHKKPLPVK